MVIGWIMSVVNLSITIEVLSDIWIGLLLKYVRHISTHYLIFMDIVWTIFMTFLLVICFNQGFTFPQTAAAFKSTSRHMFEFS
jgi:hypothetical protein